MKRIKIIATCTSLLATVFMVGCVCHPASNFSGAHTGYAPPVVYDNGCDPGCDPCGPAETCGVVDPCGPQQLCAPQPFFPKTVDCRSTFSNLSNGVILVGRGILDVTAAPFVVVGNMLSSGCRYEVLTFCDNVTYGNSYCQTVEPCAAACSSGCDSCAGGYNEGIQYNSSPDALNQDTTLLTPPRRSHQVVQASHLEPTAPVKFVQPRR